MLALMISVTGYAYRNLVDLKKNQRELYRDDMGIALDLMSMRNGINLERVILLTLMEVQPGEQPALLQKLDVQAKQITDLLQKLEGANDAGVALAMKKLEPVRRDFEDIRDRDVLPAIKAGNRAAAIKLVLGAMQEKFVAIRDIADNSGEGQLKEANGRMQDSEAQVEHAEAMLLVANVIAILIGIALVIMMERAIAVPLRKATQAAQMMATGDLSVSFPAITAKDEVGQLLDALDRMTKSWKQVLAETNTGILTLSAVVSDISGATEQTSVGASETAAAISETTTTVEEVKQTALLSSQKARTVSDAAQLANQTASDGKHAIAQSMVGMENIDEQMASIADTVMRLSEQSQAISEIVASVSGLAEQSNLLAVNAAIEAAKAGEQGRGFGVVAQEVRNLAEQSRQATKQVRLILMDIQKAISAAVMTTEKGSRIVAKGMEQTGQAEQAINALSEYIMNAAQAAAQISASSQQQLAGMDQVAIAMEQIKQVAAENAASAKQSEVSAKNLHELGQKLAVIGARFTL
jgi:methyl-accepting chemotaxis protein